MSAAVPGAASPQGMSLYSRYVLGLLMVTSILHTLDRTMISILIEPIKADLHLSDGEVGLLTGILFAIFYTGASIPIAQLADRWDRPKVLGAGVFVWTMMTALCGLASSVATMVMCRIGVAVGEAGYNPVAQSLVSDEVPPEKRSGALSLLAAGGALGVVLGFIIGGQLAQHFGWRWAFAITGIAGIPVALLLVFTLREPRRAADFKRAPALPLKSTLIALSRDRSYVLLVLAATFAVMCSYSIGMWKPAVLMRSYGMQVGQAGMVLGLTAGLASVFGFLLGGFVGNKLGRERALLFPAFASLLAAPLFAVAFSAPTGHSAAVWLILPTMLGSTWYGAIFASIQARVDTNMRAVAAAAAFFFIGVFGNGLGPSLVGWVSDMTAVWFGKESLRYAVIFIGSFEVVTAGLIFAAYRSMRGSTVPPVGSVAA